MLDFSNSKILVIGDVMLDKYWFGNTSKISPEAPVPVLNYQQTTLRGGGAANVALNVTSLGANATLLSIVGKDDAAKDLTNLLKLERVKCKFIKSNVALTTVKHRLLSNNQQLLRVDTESGFIPEEELQELEQLFLLELENCDLVIISDYDKGVLRQVSRLIEIANKHNKKTFIDPKRTNNFDIYKNASLIKPNLAELENVAGVASSEIELHSNIKNLIKKLNCEHLLLTMADKGMRLFSKQGLIYSLNPRTLDVFDVTGAGDTVIATLATAYASGYELKKAIDISNSAASIVIQKVGTSKITNLELESDIKFFTDYKILTDSDKLLHAIKHKFNGKNDAKIVFTNGCFDILHLGHLRYLQKAREYGDCLIVAVNSNNSVQKLKGNSRPINKLEDRMLMLSGLECIDFVISFTEETPLNLINLIKPDVMIKGGDYSIEEIAGAKETLARGGEVHTIDFVEGYATSNLINKIKNF